MRITRLRSVKISILWCCLFGIIVLIWTGNRAHAFSSGPAAGRTNAPGETTCTACHTSYELNSGPGSVTISGLPSGYSPNQSIDLAVTTFHPDGFLYGFQLTAIDATGAQAGTIVLTDPANTQLKSGVFGGHSRQYVEHTFAGAFPVEFNQRVWTFRWIAPSSNVGTVTFYAAGNGGNGDGEPTGDYIYTSSVALAPSEFDICIQDDGTHQTLQINLSTGGYQFTDCHGLTVGGTGIVSRRGCYVTLQDNRSDRRLLARFDTCANTASASLQLFSPSRTFSMTDRNTTNNSCSCQ